MGNYNSLLSGEFSLDTLPSPIVDLVEQIDDRSGQGSIEKEQVINQEGEQ